MRFVPFLILACTSFALSGCLSRSSQPRPSPDKTELGADKVELPATFIKGWPFVDLKINGHGPYRFLVDTGLTGTAITPRAAREVGIVFSEKSGIKATGANGQNEILPLVRVDRLESPRFSLVGLTAVVLSSELAGILQHHGVDNFGGVVGMGTLQDVLLEIDYPKHKVTVSKLGSVVPSFESGLPYTGDIPYVTLATPSAKHPVVKVLIDTGALGGGFMFTDFTSYPFCAGWSKMDGFHQGVGGSWRPLYGQLAGDLRLGAITWRDPGIYSGSEGSIGGEALVACKLVIDQKRKMLWLVADEAIMTTTLSGALEPDGRPAVYGYAGLAEGDVLVLKEVDPGSRAERAGLKVNDRVLSRALGLVPPEQGPENKVGWIRLQVTRGSERLEILLEPLPTKAALGAETNASPASSK